MIGQLEMKNMGTHIFRVPMIWVIFVLRNSTLRWVGFDGKGGIGFEATGGLLDGAKVSIGGAKAFNIIPVMPRVSLHKATNAELAELQPLLGGLKSFGEFTPDQLKERDYETEWLSVDSGNACLMINSEMGTWFIWATDLTLFPKEAWEEMIQQYGQVDCSHKPLWEGGPPLSEL